MSAADTESDLTGKILLPCYDHPRHFHSAPVAFILSFLHLWVLMYSVSVCVHALVHDIVQLIGLKFTLC